MLNSSFSTPHTDTAYVAIYSYPEMEFEDEECSLTALTQKLLDIDRPLQPSPYWTFEGKKLSDIYEETYDV